MAKKPRGEGKPPKSRKEALSRREDEADKELSERQARIAAAKSGEVVAGLHVIELSRAEAERDELKQKKDDANGNYLSLFSRLGTMGANLDALKLVWKIRHWSAEKRADFLGALDALRKHYGMEAQLSLFDGAASSVNPDTANHTVNDAKRAGWQAGSDGKNKDTNPYDSREQADLYAHWSQNWTAAQTKLAGNIGKGGGAGEHQPAVN